jgi:DivIVA domain-containing protein
LALDRQDIEKRDFPIARRGYDPDAVDAHLRTLADQVDELARDRRPSTASLASAASEQVRAIVEAAETTANDIGRQAEDEARRVRDRATSEAERTRADAVTQAQAHVTQVEEAATVMLQRVDAMENELGALIESLRTGATRLTADLTLLRGNMGDLRSSAAGTAGDAALDEEEDARAAAALEAAAAAAEAEEVTEAESQPPPEVEPEAEDAGTGKAPTVEEPVAEEAQEPAGAPDDSEGARLIALNMALNGTPREETDRYLAENFQLEDRSALLDEVYARVG